MLVVLVRLVYRVRMMSQINSTSTPSTRTAGSGLDATTTSYPDYDVWQDFYLPTQLVIRCLVRSS